MFRLVDHTDPSEGALLLALGQEIRAWRQRRKLTRDQLAEQAGISPTTLGRIERDGPVDVGDTWRLARALGIGLPDLVRRAEEAVALSPELSQEDRDKARAALLTAEQGTDDSRLLARELAAQEAAEKRGADEAG